MIDRAAFLAQIGRGSPVKDIREHDVKIRLFGDFAVIKARTSYKKPDGSAGRRLVHRRLAAAAGGLALRFRPRQPLLSASRVPAQPACESTPAGWRVVFACFLAAVFAWGFGFYAHGIYLVELQKAHGWSTGLISSIVTGHYVLGALLLPRIAEAIGRFGPRTVFLCGLAVTGGSLLLLPSVEEPWQLALLYARDGAGLERHQRGADRRHRRPVVRPQARPGAEPGAERRHGRRPGRGARPAGRHPAAGLRRRPSGCWSAIGLVLAASRSRCSCGAGRCRSGRRGVRQSRLAPLKHWHFWSISAPFAFVLAVAGGLPHPSRAADQRPATPSIPVSPSRSMR